MRAQPRQRANVFPAPARPAATGALAVFGVVLVLALALLVRGLADGVTFAAFLCYVVALALLAGAAYVAYAAYALANLRYEIEGGALTIVWGLTRQVIPLANMQRLVRGRSFGMPRVRGLALPGLPVAVGQARMPRLGTVLFYSTHRTPDDILYLITAGGRYAISPMNQAELVRVLQTATPYADPTAGIRQEVVRHPLAALPFWTDRRALLAAAAGGLLALLVTGIVFARYTGIPDPAVIPFPEGDHPAAKSALLGIPASALALWLINTVAGFALHRPLRPVAYVLLLGSIFVELLLAVAAVLAT